MRDHDLDQRVTQTLETPPQVVIPADFATRLAVAASRLPAHPPRLAAPRVGLWTLRAAFAVLILAMLLFVPWALTRSTVALTLEFLLTAEFVALVLWQSLRPSLTR